MGHEEMPDYGLKGLAVRRHVVWVHGRHDHAGIRDFRRVAAVLADDADDACADLLRELERGDKIRGDVFLQVAAADRKDEERVLRFQA